MEEITTEMMEAVALACLYREDEELALRKIITKKLNGKEMSTLLRKIKTDVRFEEVKKNIQEIEETGLIEDNLNTIMLQYNRMLQKAQFEGKYEVAARILKEIRQIKAIENEQMKFEVKIIIEKEQ